MHLELQNKTDRASSHSHSRQNLYLVWARMLLPPTNGFVVPAHRRGLRPKVVVRLGRTDMRAGEMRASATANAPGSMAKTTLMQTIARRRICGLILGSLPLPLLRVCDRRGRSQSHPENAVSRSFVFMRSRKLSVFV